MPPKKQVSPTTTTTTPPKSVKTTKASKTAETKVLKPIVKPRVSSRGPMRRA